MMTWIGLLALLLPLTAHGQDWVRDGGRFPLIDQEVTVEVKADGTSSWVERDVYDVQAESPTVTESLQKITFEPALADVKVLEMGVLSGKQQKVIPLDKIRQVEVGKAGTPDDSVRLVRLELPFSELGPGDRIWYKIQRTPKVHDIPGFFSLDLVYGFLQQEKKSEVVVNSELPLFYHVNDPAHALKIESGQSFGTYTLKVTLAKPALSVSAENLRVNTQDELRAETPRVQIASAQDWHELKSKIVNAYTGPHSKAVPPPLSGIALRLQATPDTRGKVEKLFMWLSEEMTFTGAWQSTSTGWQPRDLNEIAKTMSGDAKDFTLLTLRLLQFAGVEAEPVFVGMFPPQDHTRYLHTPIQRERPLPGTGYFNHLVIRYKQNENWVLVDPTRGLADARRTPYYLNHAWALLPTKDAMTMAQITLPERGYGGAFLQSELTRISSVEFLGRTQVKLQGELANFLKTIYFRDGEGELTKYLAAFAAVSDPKDFTYRKIDYVDRSAKDFNVELSYTAAAPESEGRNILSTPPHFLALYARAGEEQAAGFPTFPMQIDESVAIDDAFLEHEETHDCYLRGPLLSLDRRLENHNGQVLVHDLVQVPNKEPPSLPEEAQVKLGAHVQRLSACVKAAALPLDTAHTSLHINYEHQVDLTAAYALPNGIQDDVTALTTELRRQEMYLKGDAKNPALWRAKARVLRELGHVDGDIYIDEYLLEAEHALARAVELNPRDSESLAEMGITAYRRRDFAQALAAWYRAWPLEQNNFSVLQLGGLVNERLGKVESALNYYASAASRATDGDDRAWALTREADLLCESAHQCHDALLLYDKIAAIEPKNHLRLHATAAAYAKQGDFERAITLEHDALAINDFALGRQQLLRDLLSASEVLVQKNPKTTDDFAHSREHLLEAHKMDAKNSAVLSLLVTVFQEYADFAQDPSYFDTARGFLDELKALTDTDPELYAKLERQLQQSIEQSRQRVPSSQ